MPESLSLPLPYRPAASDAESGNISRYSLRHRHVRVFAFLAPPIGVAIGWLLTRLLLRQSHWEAIPAFLLFSAAAALTAIACAVVVAGQLATTASSAAPPARRALDRLTWAAVWILGTLLLASLGLSAVEALPIAVGDGP